MLEAQKASKPNYAKPRLDGMTNAKGLSMTYEISPNYRLQIQTPENDDQSSPLVNNPKVKYQVRFPLLLNPRNCIVGGISFEKEFYNLTQNVAGDIVLSEMDNKNLSNFGAELINIFSFNKKEYLISRASVNTLGDFSGMLDLTSDYRLFTVSFLYGKKLNKTKEIGYGLGIRKEYGRIMPFPIFVYNKNFNTSLGIEVLLPKQVILRNTFNKSNLIYFKSSINAARYKVNLDNAQPFENYVLRQSDVRFGAGFEKRLFSLIWFGSEFGIRKNISLDISNSERYAVDHTLNSSLSSGFYANFSVFLAPPR